MRHLTMRLVSAAQLLKQAMNRRMLVALSMGFSCGLPLLLTLSVLQAWMKEEGVDLTVIGAMSLVGLPYTLKFLWSPVMDRFVPPFLGRRRGWLLITQVLLMLTIIWLGQTDPVLHPVRIAVIAILVSFCSASQDIVVDAYRREDLTDHELGLGSSLYVNGYRLGMLLASGGGLILADLIPFSAVYTIMAFCLIPGIVTTLMTSEPINIFGTPVTLAEAVIDPLREYFSRQGALWILAFILMYKIGDSMASAMTMPFYLDMGFSKTEIGAVVKLFGFWATLAGALAGGVVLLRVGIYRGLWVFGVFQAISTAGFSVMAVMSPSVLMLSTVIAFENFTGGMGTSAFAAYMASITNKKFTATQYALLSSLMGIPRVIAAAPTGYMAKETGWPVFFLACALIAIPGLLLLTQLNPAHAESR